MHFYSSLEEIPQRGAAFTVGNDVYTITVNEYEQTNNQNIKVTHTFAKNWVLQSSYLKQNKEYRNTNIPTDILERNLHYEDYIVIDESDYSDNDGVFGEYGIFMSVFMDVFVGESSNYRTEINLASFYGRNTRNEGHNNEGGIVSVSSFAVANSIVFSAKTKNNLSVGIRRGDPDDGEDDDYCYDVFYTNDDGEFDDNALRVCFSAELYSINQDPDSFPYSGTYDNTVIGSRALKPFELIVDKSSAEQTNLTYQAHVVSALADLIIGEMITRNSPLVCEMYGAVRKNIKFSACYDLFLKQQRL